ncbi:hypothetical protein V1478_003729 [Vespula squamosa]|uniref:Uncharacterized protein n=1 Tax=Vespula squamosa TaxID=30214 RepID=A0ABD2BMP2_VESSQ
MFGSVVTLYRYKFKDHPDRNALRDALMYVSRKPRNDNKNGNNNFFIALRSEASTKEETLALGVGIINWQDKMIKQSIGMRLKSTSKGNGSFMRCDLKKNSEESI